jgi:hypothetical protein
VRQNKVVCGDITVLISEREFLRLLQAHEFIFCLFGDLPDVFVQVNWSTLNQFVDLTPFISTGAATRSHSSTGCVLTAVVFAPFWLLVFSVHGRPFKS